MINAMNISNPNNNSGIKEDDNGIGLNIDFFMSDNNTDLNLKHDSEVSETGKKRGRPRKKTINEGDIVLANNNAKDANRPYAESYNETNGLLRQSILQIDMLSADLKEQLDSVKNSKTLRKKYEYISELAGTSSSLLNTKISAIREINKSITDSHNLEMKRAKDLKIDNEMDDDKRIMDLYNAFISTPMGTYNPLGPPIGEVTVSNNNIAHIDIESNGQDLGFSNYHNNLTPEQNRMIMEHNPNIKTVVVYNQETGAKYFDVIDITTGASVPNIAKPDDFLLPDTTVNLRSGTARNANVDMTWPLIVIGNNININDY